LNSSTSSAQSWNTARFVSIVFENISEHVLLSVVFSVIVTTAAMILRLVQSAKTSRNW
jgi:hypothetical protein